MDHRGRRSRCSGDELGSWYEDADFTAAHPVRGKPGLSPAQLAMVTVLQFTGDLTDRQAADAVRGHVDWKYCLGLELELEDEGFDASVLSGFRGAAGGRGAELVTTHLQRIDLAPAG